jgi:hypothetical protein
MKKIKLLLFNMMIRALKIAESNYTSFITEYEYKDRKAEESLISFVWDYWVDEGLSTEIADKYKIKYFYDKKNPDDCDYFLTLLTYGDAFGLSSKKATNMLLDGEVENHIKPIREKIELLLQDYK